MIGRTATFVLVLFLLGLAGWQLGRAGLLAGKAWAAPILIEWAWHEGQEQGTPTPPWPWSDSYPSARMEVPALGLTRFVLEGDNMRNLAFGPVMSQRHSNAVLFGHRDSHFRFLKDLKQGHKIIFQQTGAEAETWQVTHSDIVSTNDLAVPTSGLAETIMLVTCYPFDSLNPPTDLRYVVWLHKEF
ncbi:MAG: sortase [Proteobacteria bacterium]|nr:sortase [Pseudomonadota bacterium]